MPSQPQSSAENDALVKDERRKQQAASSWTTGADAMTVEEREDEREAITHARPGGLERVVNEQRLPAEGIGAADGEIRHAFTDYAGQDSPVKRMPSGEYAGERFGPQGDWERAGAAADLNERSQIESAPPRGAGDDPERRDLSAARGGDDEQLAREVEASWERGRDDRDLRC
jgi:hypothetical protein